MKKLFYLLFVAGLLSVSLNAQVTNTVTFVADLSALMEAGFDSATDTVEIRGLDWGDMAAADVTGDRFLTVDSENANLYKTTLTITAATLTAGDSLRWKYHGYPEANFDPAWEPGLDFTAWDGRSLVLQADGTTFELDAAMPELGMFSGGIVNTVTFKADLTDLFGSGVGFFDPAVDNIEVRGFWDDAGLGWIGGSVIEGVTGPMTRNLDPGVVYETTVKLQAPEGTEAGAMTGYKFKTYPDERWADGGWEIGSNSAYTYEADGAEVEVLRKPNIFPKGEALGKNVDVLFQCYLPEDALNAYDSSLIPRDEVEFLILKGDNPAIGLWGGDWVAADTLTAGAIACYDNGKNGDLVAGDFIFSKIVTFADTLLSGGVIYKFGAQYPNAGVVSQSAPLDNSKGTGQNFSFILRAVDSLVVEYQVWPTVGTPVSVKELGGQVPNEYTLEQNYPNPFNPSTTIRYNLPASSDVSLKIFNVLGMEVANLVNQKQTAGQYEATFDASNFASGIYFYTLETSGVSISKKMMLLK